MAATGHYLKFSGSDEFDQAFDFEDMRANRRSQAPAPVPVGVPRRHRGHKGASCRGTSTIFPTRAKPYTEAAWPQGIRFGAPASGFAVIPSLLVSVENYSVERLYDDIVEGDREFSAVVRGGVTIEIGSLYLRPHAVFTTADDSYLLGGVLLGVTF